MVLQNNSKGIIAKGRNNNNMIKFKYFTKDLKRRQLDMCMVLLSILCCILPFASCEPILNNFPIIFTIQGATTFTPDAGGAAQNGYKLTIGYSNSQWLGVQFITNTGKNDVLILQINQFYVQGSTPLRTGHQVTVNDYYNNGGILNADQNNQHDISAFNFVQNKNYTIDMIRYVGSNGGEDWNAQTNMYTIQQVCFYTNNQLFSAANWQSGIKQCYYFEIDNLVSTFKGVFLKNFYINGYLTGIYGYIDGPFVSNNLYFYHSTPLFVAYMQVPAVVIEIGVTSGNVGQDFNAYSPVGGQTGDYYGKSVTNMAKDNTKPGGFQNGGLTMQHWNANPTTQINGLNQTTLRINYNRNVSTYDSYDRQLKSTFIFCLYLYSTGSINSVLTDKSCEVVQLSYHYPRMAMPIKTWEYLIKTKWIMFIITILLIFIHF